jgi:hypothetical protein
MRACYQSGLSPIHSSEGSGSSSSDRRLTYGICEGLQTGTAPTIHLQSRHRCGQPGIEGHHPPDGWRLPIGVALRQDTVVDKSRLDLGAGNQLPNHGSA